MRYAFVAAALFASALAVPAVQPEGHSPAHGEEEWSYAAASTSCSGSVPAPTPEAPAPEAPVVCNSSAVPTDVDDGILTCTPVPGR